MVGKWSAASGLEDEIWNLEVNEEGQDTQGLCFQDRWWHYIEWGLSVKCVMTEDYDQWWLWSMIRWWPRWQVTAQCWGWSSGPFSSFWNCVIQASPTWAYFSQVMAQYWGGLSWPWQNSSLLQSSPRRMFAGMFSCTTIYIYNVIYSYSLQLISTEILRLAQLQAENGKKVTMSRLVSLPFKEIRYIALILIRSFQPKHLGLGWYFLKP